MLTDLSGKPGPTWQPGHVGMFAGNSTNPSKDPTRVIEADGEKVVETPLDKVKNNSGNAYLGPRRWSDWTAPQGLGRHSLTQGEQAGVVSFLEAHLGDAYALIGDQSLPFNGR